MNELILRFTFTLSRDYDAWKEKSCLAPFVASQVTLEEMVCAWNVWKQRDPVLWKAGESPLVLIHGLPRARRQSKLRNLRACVAQLLVCMQRKMVFVFLLCQRWTLTRPARLMGKDLLLQNQRAILSNSLTLWDGTSCCLNLWFNGWALFSKINPNDKTATVIIGRVNWLNAC